jgi:CBS domain-containing protein
MARVADVMSYRPIVIDAFDSVQAAAQVMRAQAVGTLPVVERGQLVGIVTDRDLVLRSTAAGERPWESHVREVMTRDPVVCAPDEKLTTAVERMIARRIRRLIVVDDSGVVGVFSVDDLAAADETQPLALRLLQEVAQSRGLEPYGAFAELRH